MNLINGIYYYVRGEISYHFITSILKITKTIKQKYTWHSLEYKFYKLKAGSVNRWKM